MYICTSQKDKKKVFTLSESEDGTLTDVTGQTHPDIYLSSTPTKHFGSYDDLIGEVTL
jgi:hypothetical protein